MGYYSDVNDPKGQEQGSGDLEVAGDNFLLQMIEVPARWFSVVSANFSDSSVVSS